MNKTVSGINVDSIGDLSSLLDTPENEAGESGPMELSLEVIHEDPDQPRKDDNPGFSSESLGELAATIKTRGIKTPISVRAHPEVSGEYIINHGARRFRASKLAQKTTIPAFVDNDYTDDDQLIENLQRDELTAREIAEFIQKKIDQGVKKGQIAKIIGKSNAFISQHVVLLDLPDVINDAFVSGRVNDVTVVNELVKLHKSEPECVEDWMSDETQDLTRASLKLLREYIDAKNSDEANADEPNGHDDTLEEDDQGLEDEKEKKPTDPNKLKKAIIQVSYDGRDARLLLDRRPSSHGMAWVKYEDDGDEFECDLSGVSLTAVLEG